MHAIIEVLELILENLVEIAVALIELVGVFILIRAVVLSFIKYLRQDKHMGIFLAKGFSTSLSFLMGAEILRTVTAKDFFHLGVIAALVVIRASLSLLLHWEMKQEKAEEAEE